MEQRGTKRPNEYRIATLDNPGGGSVTRVNRMGAPGIADYTAVPHEGTSIGFGETFGFLVAEFLDAIAKGKTFENGSLEEGLRVAEVLDAVQLCSERRRPVRLEEIRVASCRREVIDRYVENTPVSADLFM
jgi:predicted dehydrogenase